MEAQEYYEELKMNHPSHIFEGNDIIRAFEAGVQNKKNEMLSKIDFDKMVNNYGKNFMCMSAYAQGIQDTIKAMEGSYETY